MKERQIRTLRNEAFIDGQNFYLASINTNDAWRIDLKRFRIYLKEKYQVGRAYYFIGSMNEKYLDLYKIIQEAGYILMFREHSLEMAGHKKGNVDTDIVFEIMRKLADWEDFDKVVLISGDGDYFKMVKYLIDKNRLEKLLAPSYRGMSSLYKRHIDRTYYAVLDAAGTKEKIAIIKK